MNIRRVTNLSAPGGSAIPAILLEPEAAQSAAVLLHPYGTSKEHMLGLGFALAEKGIAALAIDNCGHGENLAPIGPLMLQEVNAAVSFLRQSFRRVACTGLSIGGRLSLMSSADCIAAMSPAVVAQVSPQGKWMFENFPKPGVREPFSGYAAQLLQELGPVPAHNRPCLLLYSERDIPMILEGAKELKQLLPQAEVRYVSREVRPDVQHEVGLIRYLPRWFNHEELKSNLEAVDIVAGWLSTHQTMSAGA